MIGKRYKLTYKALESIIILNYWKILKHRLRKEGSELVTNCNGLKMPAKDGKIYTLLISVCQPRVK